VLIVVGALTMRAGSRRLKVIGALLIAGVLLQIGIGVTMVHFALPLPLATLHNAGAALLVICTVTLLRVLRPGRAIGMVPLRHGHSTR
jgi:cytochrome c oxidase assembly protein subunit 15